MTATLRYLPLGGLGEVGRNMWLLEWDRQILVIDSGLMFPTEEQPGVDLVIPDISYLTDPSRKVLGIVLTHAHEDHIGALPFVLRSLNVPVYGTRLTLGLVRPKLKEHHILREADLREFRAGDSIQLGPFKVRSIAVNHSIPDAVALAIRTPVGTVAYTGDFKLDPNPLDGEPTDMRKFEALGREGVLLLLSDSTNAERPGRCGSERELTEPFETIFRAALGRIVVATFASNIPRIQHIVRLAEEHGRSIAIAGRSLQNNSKIAQEMGFLSVKPGTIVKLEKANEVPDARLVLLCAGSQGEPLSALSRFASLKHPVVNVRKGDTVLISATPIPGNERLVSRTINHLYKHGAEVHYSQIGKVHVSGHAYAGELRDMLDAVRPRFFIPVHGEYRQLTHHARIAREAGIADDRILMIEDGQSVILTRDTMTRGEVFQAGMVFVDGMGVGDVEHVVLRDRNRLAEDGIVVVTIAVDSTTGEVKAGPDLVSKGFIEPDLNDELMEEAAQAILENIRKMPHGDSEVSVLKEAIHEGVSRVLHRRTKRRPMIIPVVTEL